MKMIDLFLNLEKNKNSKRDMMLFVALNSCLIKLAQKRKKKVNLSINIGNELNRIGTVKKHSLFSGIRSFLIFCVEMFFGFLLILFIFWILNTYSYS